MCGIFACKIHGSNAPQITLTALKTLEYRGYDSWGIAAIMDNEQWTMDNSKQKKIIVEKRIGKIGNAVLNSQLSIVHSHIALGHTRWATHGGVTDNNAHPHLSCDGRYAVVHNGIVENYGDLKAELLTHGHVFRSETDTEIIVHLVEELAKTVPFQEAVRQTFLRLTGLNAFVTLDAVTGDMVIVKNGSPLIVGVGDEGECYLASDSVALARHTKTIYNVHDRELVHFGLEGATLFDALSGEPKVFHWEQLAFAAQTTNLGSHEHFMIKEIYEQPEILEHISKSQYKIPKTNRNSTLWLVGCGSAGYAALFGQYLFAQHRIDARAVMGSEFSASIDLVGDTDRVIFLSQSGETIDLIEQANVLKSRGVDMLAIVNREGSTLTRIANEVIYLEAGPEQCVLATKSLTAKLAVLLQLCSTDQKTTRKNLERAVLAIRKMLSPEFMTSVIRPIATLLCQSHDIFIVGRGLSYPVALESMMKIREVTYLHAEGIAGGELKHGTIALIEKGTPCIIIAPNDGHYAEMISNTMELKSRGAFVIGISEKNDDCFDAHISIAPCDDAAGIVAIVSVQLIAYEMALIMGRDPDKPRNLAKSVTVK